MAWVRFDACRDLLWGRSAAVGDWRAKARAERLAIFVGLWPPTYFLLGKVMQDLEVVAGATGASHQMRRSSGGVHPQPRSREKAGQTTHPLWEEAAAGRDD
jgi:hypothetical protein